MKKLENFEGVATKLQRGGTIRYAAWVDDNGALYVQMLDNEQAGTFSNHAIPVASYASVRHSESKVGEMVAYSFESKQFEVIADNNNGAFIKAILRDLLS